MATNRSQRRRPVHGRNPRRSKSSPAPAAVRPATGPRSRPAEPSTDRSGWFLLLASVGGTAYFVLFAVQEDMARGWVDGSRSLTGGHRWAMAIIGWLTVFTIFGLIWAILLLRKRLHHNWLWAIGAVAAAMSPTVLALIPYQGHYIVHLISGPGGGAFVTGMRWATAAGFIPFLVVPFVVLNEKLKDRFGKEELRGKTTVLVVLFVVTTLIAAPLSA
jgi:hypothetical protein